MNLFKTFFAFCVFFSVQPSEVFGVEKKIFKISSTDGLNIEADYWKYSAGSKQPVILLCHQAGWSKGEYVKTGEWISSLGYDVVAIDQRSGGEVNGVVNQVHKQAKRKKLATDYLSAKKDIQSVLYFLSKKFINRKVILVGSSYSSALALRLAGEEHQALKAVVAFAPGEYFKDKKDLSSVLPQIKIPVFVTGTKNEVKTRAHLWSKIPKSQLTLFEPLGPGHHGSRALWTDKEGRKAYRKAFLKFLNKIKI